MSLLKPNFQIAQPVAITNDPYAYGRKHFVTGLKLHDPIVADDEESHKGYPDGYEYLLIYEEDGFYEEYGWTPETALIDWYSSDAQEAWRNGEEGPSLRAGVIPF